MDLIEGSALIQFDQFCLQCLRLVLQRRIGNACLDSRSIQRSWNWRRSLAPGCSKRHSNQPVVSTSTETKALVSTPNHRGKRCNRSMIESAASVA